MWIELAYQQQEHMIQFSHTQIIDLKAKKLKILSGDNNQYTTTDVRRGVWFYEITNNNKNSTCWIPFREDDSRILDENYMNPIKDEKVSVVLTFNDEHFPLHSVPVHVDFKNMRIVEINEQTHSSISIACGFPSLKSNEDLISIHSFLYTYTLSHHICVCVYTLTDSLSPSLYILL